MKYRSFSLLLVFVSAFSCNEPGILSRYRDLGSFSSRVEGQNKALAYFLKNYDSLPRNAPYRIKYAKNNPLPSEHPENALWYNKSEEILSLEVSPPDGPACYWKSVRKDVLEEAVKSIDGLRTLDTLAMPGQPTNTCL
ncbi:hypothetical protein [Spirosoma pomorum]